MTKLVLKTELKQVNQDEGTENIIDTQEMVVEATAAISVKEFEIAANSTFTFIISAYKARGAKGIRIISDIPLKLSHTYMMNNYDIGFYVKDITLFGGIDSINPPSYRDGDTIGYQGEISLRNREENPAKVKLIWYY